MADGNYPFSDRDKLLEQTGWLKAEIDALKKSQISEADLLRLETRIVKSFNEGLNSWWEHKPLELDEQIDRRIALDKKRQKEEADARKSGWRFVFATVSISLSVGGALATGLIFLAK